MDRIDTASEGPEELEFEAESVPGEGLGLVGEFAPDVSVTDAPVIEEEPAPDYPDPPRTGDPGVDQVLDAVAAAVGGPLEEQLAAFDTAHRTLQDRLADVEG